MKIEPNFRSLFYHDWINKTFCSREQSTSQVHAHTLVELKKTMKVTKLWDFDKLLRNVLWCPQGRLLGIFWFSCFDHFVDVFDYSAGRSMLSCYHGVHRGRKSFFSDTKLFFAKVLEPNFSMGRTDRSTETVADRRMIAIVDGEELEKRRASRIP